MKIKTLLVVVFLTTISFAQNIYDLTPGSKGNQIVLSISNESEIKNAEGVRIWLSKTSENLLFTNKEQMIEKIDPKVETEAIFSFDIKRDALINKKDTVEFAIKGNRGILTTKQFIFIYTLPKDYKLEQNFPNPFNPTTTIQYQLAPLNLPEGETSVILKVFDILGNEVTTLVNEKQKAGYYEIKFDASRFSSGVYIYRLTAQNYVSTKKMIVVK